MMKKVLITGDNGFVGSHLANALQKGKGFEVVGLSIKHKPNLSYKTIDFDLAQPRFPPISDIDIVLHLAADVECQNKEAAYKVNVGGTKKLLELSKKNEIKSFVYASTGSVYGFREAAFKETDPPSPQGTYAKTKYQAELLCKQYSKYFPVTILRYFYPYGKLYDDRRLINRLISNVKSAKLIELNINAKPVINPINISDAVDITVKAAEPVSQFEIFNIAGKERVSILQLIKIIEKQLKIKAKIKYNNKEVGNIIGETTKTEKIFRFEPRVSLEEGISELVRNKVLRRK